MRIGVFGGTFDPIHNGHLVVAEECRERLNIDRVLFVPAGLPPHKQARTLTSPHHRMAMVRLAIASNPRFEASSIELGRPGPSYSVDTLRQLRQNQRDGTDVFFIMGADSLKELPSWHDPAGLIASCRLVVVSRPGSPAVDSSHLDNLYLGAKGAGDDVRGARSGHCLVGSTGRESLWEGRYDTSRLMRSSPT